ncbi:MAG: two-component system, OmpR family, sensor kinase [Chloroflexota bacterium]|jgi:signal transduction histidine kinase|nr:two-component system, OmpR family, sensor kinase [Chloroflexota bacterium]
MRRAGLVFVAFFFVATGLGTLAFHLAENVVGSHVSGGLRLGSLAILLIAFLFLVFSGRLFRRITTPVGDLVEAANRIESGDLSTRVREHGPGEVRSVARAFNSMSEQLQATDARRRTFLADVTHELRTPLSVIRGRAEGILEGVYPGDREHVAPILESARTLELLIEDLRTLALAEAGGLTLRRESVDIGLLAAETAGTFADQARLAGVTLAATAAPDLPPAQADPARIQSVISNLISNALRHTPTGGHVDVRVDGDGDQLRVAVADTGAGIPAELLPHVFDRFVKGGDSSGSGLGLAIARDLVLAHGGHIDVTSAPGEGTTLTFSLPRQ